MNATTSNANLGIDLYQGRDEQDRKFGYINGGDMGGYFFTWMPTLQETIDSLDADEMAPPTHNWRNEAATFLRGKIGQKFDDVSDDVASEDAATYGS